MNIWGLAWDWAIKVQLEDGTQQVWGWQDSRAAANRERDELQDQMMRDAVEFTAVWVEKT